MATTNNKQQIGLLFGMAGEGKIDGASGARIKSQLQSIVNELNRSSTTKIKFQYEFDVKKVEKEINNATKKAVEPKTSKYSKGLVNYYKDLEKQSDSFNKKNISGIDFEIKKREESGKRFSHQIKVQMTEAERLKKAVSNSQNALLGMGGKADERTYANTGIKAVTDAYKKYFRIVKEAQVAEKAIDSNNPQTQQAFIDKVNEAKIAQQQLNAVFSNSTAFEKQETIYQKVIARITEYQAKFKETLKNTPQLAAQLEELRQKLDSNTFVGTENKANQMFVSLTNQIRQAGGEAETLGQKIRRIFGEKLGYGIIASAAMMARQAVKEVYNNVVELDKAVVDLQIATGKNREEVKELVSTYSELGRELGATTSEVAQASDSWLRQGYSIEQVNELTRNSIMLAKLGQMESADATIALTSALRGYELQAEDVGSVTDKLVAVDMTAAVTAGQLATAMAECANSARLAGVDMNTLLGYLTQVMQTTQDAPESVGTFAKTLFARMGNIKAGKFIDDSTGEDLNDVEATLGKLGIKLRSTTNEFRDFDDVLYDIAQAWNNYSSVEQHAVATALGATRQQEKLLVLMSGYNDAIEYAETATNSAGTANQKYEAVLSSVEAAQNSFTASFEDFSQAFLDSDLVAGVIRFGDGFMQVLTGITKFLSFGDGLVGQLALITAGLWALNAAMAAFNTSASTGEPIEALTYHAREYSGGDTERVNKIIVLFTREYLEKPTSLGLIA